MLLIQFSEEKYPTCYPSWSQDSMTCLHSGLPWSQDICNLLQLVMISSNRRTTTGQFIFQWYIDSPSKVIPYCYIFFLFLRRCSVMVLLPADMHQDSSFLKCSLWILGSQQLCSHFITANFSYFKYHWCVPSYQKIYPSGPTRCKSEKQEEFLKYMF